jgi:Cu/Zn superoxide dismutase
MLNAIPEVAMSGQLVNVSATAVAGWNMKVEAMEYFIGEEGLSGTGTAVVPVDGAFDEQTEEFEFMINTTGLEPGDHAIYVHAMERGKWGPMNRAAFAIEFPEPESPKHAMAVKPEQHLDLPMINAATVIIIGIGAWLLLTLRRKRGL